MDQGDVCSVWLPYRLMLILLIFCTISVMVTPTVSASDYTPLVRPRLENHSSNGNESSISEADVQKRIQEVFNRKGYSNPDPSPNDSQEASPELVAVRIDSQPTRRHKRPLWKIDETFDPKKSYVIKHPNGTITYVPPRDLDISGTVAAVSTTTPSSNKSNVLIDKMSEASIPISNKTECTPENPICSNVINYPHELINQIMDRQKLRFSEVFGTDVVVQNGDKLAQRFDNVDDEGNPYEYICDSEETVHYPRSGFNMDKKSIKIVNTKEYMQGVRVETCRNKHKPCEKLKPMFTKTECKQFFHYRTLLAIHPDTNEPYKEKILLPSCCKCVILQ